MRLTQHSSVGVAVFFWGVFSTATLFAEPSPTAQFLLSVGGATGRRIRPLLGVNIGPAPSGKDARNPDLTAAYRQIGVNFIRTHDFYGPLDMSAMYPDWRRDPDTQAAYDFRASDLMWRAITAGGFEPYLRLGDSWNNARAPLLPAQRANWVRAAVEVVRHYREGKWDGFKTPFRYVEIWNEPNHLKFWPVAERALEYAQLYVEAAKALKTAFPDLLIGGPGVTPAAAFLPVGRKWTDDFLAFVKEQGAPLDFFSWHLYANNPFEWIKAAKFYRSRLDAFGFKHSEMHVTEWNTSVEHLPDHSPEALALRTGSRGAAILTAAWIAMQKMDVTIACFYRGPDPSLQLPTFFGIFYADGRPKRIALAFSLWAKFAHYTEELNLKITPDGDIWALAGKDSAGNVALLLANPSTCEYSGVIKGAPPQTWRMFQVSDRVGGIETTTQKGSRLKVPAESVCLLLAGNENE